METVLSNWFVEGLKLIMKKKGLSQVSIADKIGVNKSYISRVLSGKQFCSEKLSERISQVVNVKVENISQAGKEQLDMERGRVAKGHADEAPRNFFPEDVDSRPLFIEKSFHERLLYFRELSGLSVKEVADLLNIQTRTIYHYENGERKIPLHYIFSLYLELNLNPSWVLTGLGLPYIYSSVEEMIVALNRDFESLKLFDLFYLEEFIKYQNDIVNLFTSLQEICSKLIFRKDLIKNYLPLIEEIHKWLNDIPISDFGDVESDDSFEEDEDEYEVSFRQKHIAFLECRRTLLSISSNAVEILNKLI